MCEAKKGGGKSLAVELPQVEFIGTLCASEDGTKPFERSFSAVNLLWQVWLLENNGNIYELCDYSNNDIYEEENISYR